MPHRLSWAKNDHKKPGFLYVHYGEGSYVYPVRTLLPHSAVPVCPAHGWLLGQPSRPEEKQGPETDSDRDTDAATADSGENEVRRRNMRECEDAMMEDTASRRGYAPTAAWDEGNMIQAMARMKNPTIAWRFGDG